MVQWSTVVWDTQSGVTLATMEASAGSWQRGGVSEQTHVFALREQGYDRPTLRDIFGRDRPRDRTLTVLANNEPVYHGLILDTDYSPQTQQLTVTHKDVRELASGRTLFDVGGSDVTFNWSGLSWRGMATRVARLAFRTGSTAPNWLMRVNVPADEVGTKTMKTFGYEFRTAESLLSEISSMPGGPDLEFQPVRDGAGLYGWDFLVGDPYLSGPTLEYHLQATESPLRDVSVKTFGADKITGVHGVGEGSEWKMIRGGVSQPATPGGVARVAKISAKLKDLAKVNDRAQGHLESRRSTYQVWSFNINADDVNVHLLRIGSVVRVESRGDPWIADGVSEHRILKFGGSLSTPDKITLTLERIS